MFLKGVFRLKVERINNNKAKISLTLEELRKKKITLKDIKQNKLKAEDFFLELLEETRLIEEFEIDSNELFVEAIREDNLLTITITKMLDISCKDEIKQANIVYKISSNIYVFDSSSELKDFAIKANLEKLYIPKCMLYYFNNKFFLVFSKKDIRCSQFIKSYSILSEYASHYSSSSYLKDILNEHATLLFNNADAAYILEYPYFLT